MDGILGQWRFDRTKDTGLQDFFEATGVPQEYRQELTTIDPLFTWTKQGDSGFTQRVEIKGEEPREYSYTLGVQFEMEKVKGLKFKCTITWDGKAFIEEYFDYKDEPFKNQRKIQGDVMSVITTAKGKCMSQELRRVLNKAVLERR